MELQTTMDSLDVVGNVDTITKFPEDERYLNNREVS